MTLRQHLNRCIKFYLQRECHEISFICCFDVTAENLIWLVVFLFFCSWWPAEEYLFAALQTFLFQCYFYFYFDILDIQLMLMIFKVWRNDIEKVIQRKTLIYSIKDSCFPITFNWWWQSYTQGYSNTQT